VASLSAGLSLACILAILVSTALTIASMRNVTLVRQMAKQASDAAMSAERLQLANRAVSEMLTEVSAETLRDMPHMERVRAALLDKALLLYEHIGQTSADQREASRHETALANFQLGEIQRTLGKVELSEQYYRVAIAQLGMLSNDFPQHAPYRRELALSQMWLAELLREHDQTARADEAEQHYDAAIRLQTDLAALADEEQVQYQVDLSRSYLTRAILHRHRGLEHVSQGRQADARSSFERSRNDSSQAESLLVQLIARPQLNFAQQEECRVSLARTHFNRGILQRSQIDKHNPDDQLFEDARQNYLKAIDQLRSTIERSRLLGHPERLEHKLELAKCHNNLANLLMEYAPFDNQPEAVHHNAVAVRLCKELNVGTPAVRKELASFYNTKAISLAKQPAQAIVAWENATDVLETVWHENNANESVAELLGKYLCNICFFYQGLGKHAEAIQSIDRLAKLNCKRSRFETAAKYMEAGREIVQGQDPALAEKYQQLAALLHNKARAAQ
jgi:tetratricopeptide (TPR) repeat protein